MADLIKIPFTNLKAQYESIRNEIDSALTSTFQLFDFSKGQAVTDFERSFATVVGATDCVSTASGTDALFIALKSLGIGSGDEVITPAMSWISSAETISLCGARPVFVDIDDIYYTLDPARIEEAITSKTRAIIAVHLYGQVCDMNAIRSLCTKYGLSLIEDCAQAHLSKLGDTYAGGYGDVGAFSFYPTKNLGAYGEAGCIITSNRELALFARRFANHGALQRHDHEIEGINSRIDTLQAAVLNVKLRYLEGWNSKRISNALVYADLLFGLDEVVPPAVRLNSVHTFHIYAIRCRERDRLKSFLLQQGIQTLVHYPKALINLNPYRSWGQSARFPVAAALQQNVLSLPIYPELSESDLHFIAEKIKAFYRKSSE